MRTIHPNPLRTRTALALSSALAIAFAGVAGAQPAQDGSFELTDAVPDDVFVVTWTRPNPERAFLDAYWAEVGEAFLASGVLDGLRDIVLGLADEETRAELERVEARIGELFHDIDWASIGGGETVFAERLRRPLVFGEDILMTPQDGLLLFRTDAETAARGFSGIRTMLEACCEELETATGLALEIEESTLDGTTFVRVDLTQLSPEMPALPLAIGVREDVLALTFGPELDREVAALLAGVSEHRPISDTPRFRAAVAALPEPEDAFEYVDMHNLSVGMKKMADDLIGHIQADVEKGARAAGRIENARRNAEVIALLEESYPHYERGDIREALRLMRRAHEIDPTDSVVLYDLACLTALLGESEEALGWLEKAVEGGFWSPGKIESDDDLASLRERPRFHAAVERAEQACCADQRMWIDGARAAVDRLVGAIGVVDYSATVRHTQGYASYADSITALAADARENPFYPVVTSGRPVADFARYLPAESVSFSVSEGLDLDALYTFLEDTVAAFGPTGAELLQAWDGIQEEHGFDARRDLIGWIDGESISVSFPVDGRDSWAWMLKVTDAGQAREKVAFLLEFLPAQIEALAAKVPQLAVLGMRVTPCEREGMEGFHEVAFAMMPTPMVCGVHEDWMVLSSSADAALLTWATAAGEHPNVLTNEERMAHALLPEGPVTAVSLTDHSGDAEMGAAILGSVAMAGGMAASAIPEPEAREVVARLCGMLSDLAPVVRRIDFYESSAKVSSFDGKAWRMRAVTHFTPPLAPNDF